MIVPSLETRGPWHAQADGVSSTGGLLLSLLATVLAGAIVLWWVPLGSRGEMRGNERMAQLLFPFLESRFGSIAP